MTRVAIATCTRTDLPIPDDVPLAAALRELGHEAERVVWNDPAAEWSSFDVCVVRSTWDYTLHVERFGLWLGHVASCCRVVNEPALMRWNLHKAYLLELSLAGVRIIPTRLAGPQELDDAIEAMQREHPGGVVVKPAVGAGAVGLRRLAAGETLSGSERAAALGPLDAALVQPMLGSIRTAGETSLVWIDGRLSHAVRKVPRPGDIRVQVEWGGVYSVVEPTGAQVAVAEAALAACPERPLYARIDLADLDDGTPALMELELIEPELFFVQVPEAAGRLAWAVAAYTP